MAPSTEIMIISVDGTVADQAEERKWQYTKLATTSVSSQWLDYWGGILDPRPTCLLELTSSWLPSQGRVRRALCLSVSPTGNF